MTKSQEVQESIDQQQIDNARVGYQVATSLWIARSQIFWSQFGAIMTGNSIVLATATFAVYGQQSTPVLSVGVASVGLVLCALLWVLHARATGYIEYWSHSARELEEQFLNNPVTILSRGGRFGEGQPVILRIGGEHEHLQMPRIGWIFPVRYVVRLVIAVFAIVHLAILVRALS